MKKITFDLRASSVFGVQAKFLEMLPDLILRGYKIRVINKDWSVVSKSKTGVTFDKNSGKYSKSTSANLYEPSIHPIDFFENLVLPTFENIEYSTKKIYKVPFNFIFKLKPLFLPSYFTNIDITSRFMDKEEIKAYHQQQVDALYGEKFSIRKILSYTYFLLYIKIFRKFKIQVASRPFRYKLKNDLLNDNVKKIIKDAQNENIPYVLITPNWDDDKKFEVLDDRLRGIFSTENEFNSMVRYVKDLDKYALEGKIKFVLASKKAVDWDKIIKSDFLDLRNFEEKNLSLSQTIYIIQEITKLTINWPSTFNIWMTNCDGMLHLTWGSKKDTANWARNNYHKEDVKVALKKIGLNV